MEVRCPGRAARTFTLYPLPHPARRNHGWRLHAPVRSRYDGRVLVVEDNAAIGEFASQLLQDLGYHTELRRTPGGLGAAGGGLAVRYRVQRRVGVGDRRRGTGADQAQGALAGRAGGAALRLQPRPGHRRPPHGFPLLYNLGIAQWRSCRTSCGRRERWSGSRSADRRLLDPSLIERGGMPEPLPPRPVHRRLDRRARAQGRRDVGQVPRLRTSTSMSTRRRSRPPVADAQVDDALPPGSLPPRGC